MELQWPLIIFTTLIAWSAGLFACQCALALKGEAVKSQMPAWIVSAILLVVGGIAVFLHLEHWERIFNGFGHITSGITQELIAIVVLAVIAIIYLVMLRKNEGKVPAWLAIVGILVSLVLLVVMAHSYVMPARPAWDSPLWIVYIVGNALVLGGITMAIIAGIKEADAPKLAGPFALGGGVINLVGAIAYGAFLLGTANIFVGYGLHFDPTLPLKGMVDAAGVIAGQSMMVWVGAVAIGAALPLIFGLIGWKTKKWTVWGSLAVICALVGCVCMRIAFYGAGLSAFALY